MRFSAAIACKEEVPALWWSIRNAESDSVFFKILHAEIH
jgi:hypothetical protein